MINLLVQYSSITCCGLIILVLLMFPLTNLYIKYYNFKANQYKKYCRDIFQKSPSSWTKLDRKILQHVGHNLLGYMQAPLSKKTQDLVFKEFLLPWARARYRRRNWQARYQAAMIFERSSSSQDKEYIISLIKDPVLIVATLGIQTAIKHPDKQLINLIINELAQSRSIRQSFLIEFIEKQIIKIDHQIIAQAIADELMRNANLYSKIFCYNWLVRLKIKLTDAMQQALQDSKHKNINISIAATHYLALDSKNHKQLLTKLHDANWQVRVAVMHDLMLDPNKNLIPLFEQELQHPQWWVRHTAKHALIELKAL